MKRRNFFSMLVLITTMSLLAVSCQPKEDNAPEEPTLLLSSSTLLLDNGAQTPDKPQITVTTNQLKITTSCTESWLKAEVANNGIKISALENNLGKDRQADVLVFAGGLTEKIEVTQSAADIVLAVSHTDINVPRQGDELLISVKSNAKSWQIGLKDKAAESWIKLEQIDKIVKVSVSPNMSTSIRSAIITATAGIRNEEIIVTQQGIGTIDFLLPILKRKTNSYEIITYETNQNNYLTKFLPANPSFRLYTETLKFAYGTKYFQACEYNCDVLKGTIEDIILTFDLINNENPLTKEPFLNYLKANNFTDIAIDKAGNLSAIYDTPDAIFDVFTYVQGDIHWLVFQPTPKQTRSYPTFSKFPWDKSDRLQNTNWISSKIIEAETQDGNTCEVELLPGSETIVDQIKVNIKESNNRETPSTRMYFMDTKKLQLTTTDLTKEMLTVWKNTELMVFEEGGEYYLTDEFKKLMTDNGFTFEGYNQNYELWYNKAKKLMIVPKCAKYKKILDGAIVASINYFKYEKPEGASISNASKNYISQILDEQDRRLGRIK